jgi:Spx/MgsR family transcriptional regulator
MRFNELLLTRSETKMVKLYGIPNCDTMKKARRWLDEHEIAYQFHNYKKVGVDEGLLRRWVDQLGWETLLNRRGMMWRKLDDSVKANINEANAICVMLETPSIINRPVLEVGDTLQVGFREDDYSKLFSQGML